MVREETNFLIFFFSWVSLFIIFFSCFFWAYFYLLLILLQAEGNTGLNTCSLLTYPAATHVDLYINVKKSRGPFFPFCSLCQMFYLVPALLPGEASTARCQSIPLVACHQWDISYSASIFWVWRRLWYVSWCSYAVEDL